MGEDFPYSDEYLQDLETSNRELREKVETLSKTIHEPRDQTQTNKICKTLTERLFKLKPSDTKGRRAIAVLLMPKNMPHYDISRFIISIDGHAIIQNGTCDTFPGMKVFLLEISHFSRAKQNMITEIINNNHWEIDFMEI
jgi:hypothetical protein